MDAQVSGALRRVVAVAVAATAVASLSLASAAGAVTPSDAIAVDTNAYRVDTGVDALARHGGVESVAQAWAVHLRDLNEGRTWTAIELSHNPDYASQMPSAGRTGAAENVAFACGRGGPAGAAAAVVRAWKNSAGHRANMLNAQFTDIGIGTAYDSSNDCLYAVQNFGVYRSSSSSTQFWDVPSSHRFFAEIDWLAQERISTGYRDGSYRPSHDVTRDAMAAFLYRLAGEPDFTAPATSPFEDVSTRSPFFTEIAWLASTGISTGWADGTFRPGENISREAMAAFLYRYHRESVTGAASATTAFTDLEPGDPFLAEISWLFDSGITTGYSDGTFRPLAPVTREAMAAFLERSAT